MIDVTSVPDAKVGDEVVLFGYQGDTLLPVEEIADKLGTITNEVFCMVGRRVPRVYVRGGKEVARVEYLQHH
jgi:alanine racemase